MQICHRFHWHGALFWWNSTFFFFKRCHFSAILFLDSVHCIQVIPMTVDWVPKYNHRGKFHSLSHFINHNWFKHCSIINNLLLFLINREFLWSPFFIELLHPKYSRMTLYTYVQHHIFDIFKVTAILRNFILRSCEIILIFFFISDLTASFGRPVVPVLGVHMVFKKFNEPLMNGWFVSR